MPSPVDSTNRLEEFRNNWPALVGCLIGHGVGIHTLPPYTVGLFISPMGAEFGWSRISISIGVTVSTLGLAIGAPIAGALVNRLGERALIVFSILIVVAGYLALSAMGPSIGIYWAILLLTAMFGVGCSPVTLSRILVSVFDKSRGTALGITLIGTGLAGTLPPLILAPVMATYGWRAGYVALAVIVAVAWPIILGLFVLNRVGKPHPPAAPTETPAAAIGVGELVQHPVLIRLMIAFFCVAIATGGVVVHFSPMLIDAGFSALQAGRMASLIGISIIVGRLLTGIAIDHVFAPRLAMLLMGASAVGFVLLAVDGPPLIPYAALLVGMSLGAEIDLVIYLTSRYFLPHMYGRAFGVLYSSFLAGVAVSPVIYALLHAPVGNYTLGFVWAAVFLAIGAVLFATLPKFPVRS